MTLRIFENWDLDVQVSTLFTGDGEIFFKAKDVALALGYANTDDAVKRHVSEEYNMGLGDIPRLPRETQGTLNFYPTTLFLREPGLYELIFSSHLPAARNFRKWEKKELFHNNIKATL